MILDSSAIIAFHSESDVHHKDAVELFTKLEKEDNSLIISDYIINKTISVILRKNSLEKSLAVLDSIMNHQKISIHHTSQEEFYEILEVFKKQKESLSFIDCSILWLATKSNLKVCTYDKNLEKELKNRNNNQ